LTQSKTPHLTEIFPHFEEFLMLLALVVFARYGNEPYKLEDTQVNSDEELLKSKLKEGEELDFAGRTWFFIYALRD
jgi:hypothetical protein